MRPASAWPDSDSRPAVAMVDVSHTSQASSFAIPYTQNKNLISLAAPLKLTRT